MTRGHGGRGGGVQPGPGRRARGGGGPAAAPGVAGGAAGRQRARAGLVVAADRGRAGREPAGGAQEVPPDRVCSWRGVMFETVHREARTVVVLAQQDARERGDSAIGTGHVLRALFAVPDNLAVMVLEGFSVGGPTSRPTWPGARRAAAAGSSRTPTRSPRWASTSTRCAGAGRGGVRSRRAGPGPRAASGRWRGGHIPFAQGVQEGAGAGAARGAARCGHNYIGTEHMLLGLLHGGGPRTTCSWRGGCGWTSRG